MEGWIKYHRKSVNNALYFSEKFNKWHAWIDLLTLASHKRNIVYINNKKIVLQEGQLCYSQLTLSKRWKWCERSVHSFLEFLQQEGMINFKSTNTTTVITIMNWNIYQHISEQTSEQTSEQKTQQVQNCMSTNKNDKNVKNEKNNNSVTSYCIPGIDEAVIYFTENGYREDIARKAYRYYEANNWHDKNGKQIINWKQKMNSVWFKPENKIKVKPETIKFNSQKEAEELFGELTNEYREAIKD